MEGLLLRDERRLWDKALIGDDCWEWQANKDSSGYGRIRVNGKMMGAHRIVWMLFHGDIPEGLHVLHSCDNPPCIRPDHLFLGTHQENMDDRNKKGRSKGGHNGGWYSHMREGKDGA